MLYLKAKNRRDKQTIVALRRTQVWPLTNPNNKTDPRLVSSDEGLKALGFHNASVGDPLIKAPIPFAPCGGPARSDAHAGDYVHGNGSRARAGGPQRDPLPPTRYSYPDP
eukprot:9196821-Pyramimonas_sp.AAC.2